MFQRPLSFTLTLLLLSSLCTQLTYAQISLFEGFNLHAGLGEISQNVFKSDMVLLSNPQVPVYSPPTNSSGPLINIGAGYNQALSEKYLLGIEFNASARDSKHLGSINYVGPYSFGSSLWNTNQYTLSLTPGLMLTPETIVYAKFGLMRTTSMCSNDNAQACASNHLSGQNLGLGAKYAFKDSSNYFYVEGNKNQLLTHRLTTIANPVQYSINGSTLNFVMGFGHHFH